jgi:hypothetical protein
MNVTCLQCSETCAINWLIRDEKKKGKLNEYPTVS